MNHKISWSFGCAQCDTLILVPQILGHDLGLFLIGSIILPNISLISLILLP